MRPDESAIAPSTGIDSATIIAEMLTARVQRTVPCTISPTITRAKNSLKMNVTISVVNAEFAKS